MQKRILHIAKCDKFIPPFIDFVKENFDFTQHEFLLNDGMAASYLSEHKRIYLAKNGNFSQIKYYLKCMIDMHYAKKIILHGLFDKKVVTMLFFMPWLLKKCYWVIWGGDLYIYQKGEKDWRWQRTEFFRRPVIKNMGSIVGYISGDYELAKKWYGAKGRHISCFMYPSNLYKDYRLKKKKDETINIQVGNSADPSNNHTEILERLLTYKEQNIRIFAPISYGNTDYANELIEFGNTHFGEKFIPLLKFMPFNEYLDYLSKIDIAIFNHKRQQAMGNSIVLSGLGKKIFMRNDVPQWTYLKYHGIKVYDNQFLDLNILSKEVADQNRKKVSELFSKDNLLAQLNLLFSEH